MVGTEQNQRAWPAVCARTCTQAPRKHLTPCRPTGHTRLTVTGNDFRSARPLPDGGELGVREALRDRWWRRTPISGRLDGGSDWIMLAISLDLKGGRQHSGSRTRQSLTVQREYPDESDGDSPGAASRSMKKRDDQGVLGAATDEELIVGDEGWGRCCKPRAVWSLGRVGHVIGVTGGGRGADAAVGKAAGAEVTDTRCTGPPGVDGTDERCTTGIARRGRQRSLCRTSCAAVAVVSSQSLWRGAGVLCMGMGMGMGMGELKGKLALDCDGCAFSGVYVELEVMVVVVAVENVDEWR